METRRISSDCINRSIKLPTFYVTTPLKPSSMPCCYVDLGLNSFLPLPHKSNLGPISDPDRRKIRHRLAVVLRVHRLARLAHRGQQLEVVDVVRWREGVEEFGFVLETKGERGMAWDRLGWVRWDRRGQIGGSEMGDGGRGRENGPR